MLDLDQLLSLCVRVAWVLFAIYIALIFIQSLIHEGLIIALFRLVSRQVFFPLLIPIALGLLSAAVIFVNPTQVAVVVNTISRWRASTATAGGVASDYTGVGV